MQVVSYADLKRCVAGAFGELQVASHRSAAMTVYGQSMLGARGPMHYY